MQRQRLQMSLFGGEESRRLACNFEEYLAFQVSHVAGHGVQVAPVGERLAGQERGLDTMERRLDPRRTVRIAHTVGDEHEA